MQEQARRARLFPWQLQIAYFFVFRLYLILSIPSDFLVCFPHCKSKLWMIEAHTEESAGSKSRAGKGLCPSWARWCRGLAQGSCLKEVSVFRERRQIASQRHLTPGAPWDQGQGQGDQRVLKWRGAGCTLEVCETLSRGVQGILELPFILSLLCYIHFGMCIIT